MGLPISDLPQEDTAQLSDEQAYSIIRTVVTEMESSNTEMDESRDYYNGEQELKYSTTEFKRAFGTLFDDFKANWCDVAITATQNRLEMDRIVFRDGELGEIDDDSTSAVWNVLRDNDIDELENDLYSSAMIESRAAVIVWPGGENDDQDVLLTVERGQVIFISYYDDNPRRPQFAVKKWRTSLGEVFVTLYTEPFVYKYKVPQQFVEFSSDIFDKSTFDTSGWEKRTISGEEWPLPNPFARIPIVEFRARKNRSELKNIIPIQDAINKTIINMMVAGEYASHTQTYIISSNEEPTGGWKKRPGGVWQIQPEVDLDGKALPTAVGSLPSEDPSNFIQIIEHFLAEFSNLSSTPGYYIFNSNSQSGRGDAPSGDSLKVSETTLIKKVENYQQRFDRRWIMVAELILEALGKRKVPEYAEVNWTNPQKHFMGMILEEGRKMIDELGLPHEYAWAHIGLSEAQIRDAKREMEKRQEDELKREQAMKAASQPDPKAGGSADSSTTRSTEDQMKNGSTPNNT